MKLQISVKRLLATFAFVVAILFSSNSANIGELSCEFPTNIVKTFQSSSNVSFSWQGNAVVISVYAVRKDNGLSSQQFTPNGNTVTLTGLQPGLYTVYFVVSCDDQTVEIGGGWDDLLMG